ncbi:MAG: GNAT family N-acetyltransferase [Agathobacter sp.]|nr:GNAT family N-acetyltransferase [Agathobacter sp.]
MQELYCYQMKMPSPYFFSVDFEVWEKSFYDDIDGEGRKLFQELNIKEAYEGDKIVGFIQYGKTAFGFDENGEISEEVSYPIIRAFYFEKDRKDVGNALLEFAMRELNTDERIYAFFHYFGMSCFARHGKLFESFPWVEEVLKAHGFVVEHENVYYSSVINEMQENEIQLDWHEVSKGGQQVCDFLRKGKQIGGCEIHYVTSDIAYLRWIYLNDDLQNQGLGSKCMDSLKHALKKKGCGRLDTDTALNNHRAQHYYEKKQFIREGITRSYYTKG